MTGYQRHLRLLFNEVGLAYETAARRAVDDAAEGPPPGPVDAAGHQG